MPVQAFVASLHKGHKKHVVPQLKKAWAATKAFVQHLTVHPQVLPCMTPFLASSRRPHHLNEVPCCKGVNEILIWEMLFAMRRCCMRGGGLPRALRMRRARFRTTCSSMRSPGSWPRSPS